MNATEAADRSLTIGAGVIAGSEEVRQRGFDRPPEQEGVERVVLALEGAFGGRRDVGGG